jgi:hypothetical protein
LWWSESFETRNYFIGGPIKQHNVSSPTQERCVTSCAARTQYKPGEDHPPHIKVKDAIAIHCHAHEGQRNPLNRARRASLAEMKGLPFKSIPRDPAKNPRGARRRQSLGRRAERYGKEFETHVTSCSSGLCRVYQRALAKRALTA